MTHVHEGWQMPTKVETRSACLPTEVNTVFQVCANLGWHVPQFVGASFFALVSDLVRRSLFISAIIFWGKLSRIHPAGKHLDTPHSVTACILHLFPFSFLSSSFAHQKEFYLSLGAPHQTCKNCVHTMKVSACKRCHC